MPRSILPILILLSSCGSCGEEPSPPAQPPGPVVSLDMPVDLQAALPKTEDGKPIVLGWSPFPSAEMRIEMVYDQNLDTPRTRWAECLSRVTGCYRTNPGRPIAGCVDLIEVCADDSGGRGCCPNACIERFKQELERGADERSAIAASFVEGSCVTGRTARALRRRP